MHGNHRLANVALVTLFGGLTGLWGCGDSGGITTPSASSPAPAVSASALSAEVVTALDTTLQDEFQAETIYLGVLGDLGDLLPFANIVYAEERHSEAIARAYGNHGLIAPASLWTLDNVPHFGSPAEACETAVSEELKNVALYDLYLALDLPPDVRTVFENNRAASLERHLPAFQACSCQTCPVS